MLLGQVRYPQEARAREEDVGPLAALRGKPHREFDMVHCQLQHHPQVRFVDEVPLVQKDNCWAASPTLVNIPEVLLLGGAKVVQSLQAW